METTTSARAPVGHFAGQQLQRFAHSTHVVLEVVRVLPAESRRGEGQGSGVTSVQQAGSA